MKIVIVGGVAGGASAAARLRRLDATAEIIMFEKGEHVSFSNCCLPYHLSDIVPNSGALVLMTPEKFKKQHNIEARVKTEVLSIDRKAHTVRVRDLGTLEEYEESYDKLILSPGAEPIRPQNIKGIEGENVYTIRNVADIQRVKTNVKRTETVAIIGGGFIGVEAAENLALAGKKVILIEGTEQIMAPFDYDMVQILHKELYDRGVELHLSSMALEITEKDILIQCDSGKKRIPTNIVICAIGVVPCTGLAQKAGLKIGSTGGIAVNQYYQTSDPDIYAVGDVIESYNKFTGETGRLSLAGPAQRQARAAANHIYRVQSHNQNSFIGSNCIRVFEQNAASVGLSVKAAQKAGISCDSVLLFSNDKVGLMPESHYMAFKLVFETPSGRILGAQAIGKGNVTQRIDVIAAMVSKRGTVQELQELELCYSPVFGTAKDVVNLAGFVAENVLSQVFRQISVSEIRSLVEDGAYIVDVREENEYAQGHFKTAHNLPLSQLWERMEEIPKDIPVYLHCRSGQRSYYAICALQGNGYRNVVNISGSFLGASLYEYFNDQILSRDPIVTAYNFK